MVAAPAYFPILLDGVFANPSDVGMRFTREVWGLDCCDLLFATSGAVGYRIELRPWRYLAEIGYPVERAGLLIVSDGSTFATPHNAEDRSWLHRNPHSLFKELCLWDSSDVPGLRWTWPDGLVALVTVIHRHLLAEEYARRHHNVWPVEDSPHGAGPHPIRTAAMRIASERWPR